MQTKTLKVFEYARLWPEFIHKLIIKRSSLAYVQIFKKLVTLSLRNYKVIESQGLKNSWITLGHQLNQKLSCSQEMSECQELKSK